MKGIQGTLFNLMGNDSKTAELLRDNPMMAGQALSNFLASGGAKQYSYDSVAMQVAGIARGNTDEAYITPGQKVENAAMRMGYVAQQFVSQGGADILGMTEEEMRKAVKENPNFLKEKITDNTNTEQKAALQNLLNQQFVGHYGRQPTAPKLSKMSTES